MDGRYQPPRLAAGRSRGGGRGRGGRGGRGRGMVGQSTRITKTTTQQTAYYYILTIDAQFHPPYYP